MKKKKPPRAPSRPHQIADLDEARLCLEEAVALADDPTKHSHGRVLDWIRRVEAFSAQVSALKVHSYIAALGNALLAKASNVRIDVFSLKASADHPGAYDARRTSEKVLVPAAQKHKFHLGVTGPQPLNGNTWMRHQRIESRMVVLKKARPLLDALLELLQEVALMRRPEAIEALAGFIVVRRRYQPKYTLPEGLLRFSTYEDLANAVDDFVRARLEGGGRAQAAASALLDATFGAERVRLGKRNEPDRQVPGDIGIRSDDGEEGKFERVLEVRDKVVHAHTIQPAALKAVNAGVRKVTLIAVGEGQEPVDESACKEAARLMGADLDIFTSWVDLVRSLAAWSGRPQLEWVEEAVGRVRERLTELEFPAQSVAEWDALTLKPEASTAD